MKKWKEILADKSLPDDFVIASKDGSTSWSLGELRAQDAESEGAVSRRLTEIEKREKTLSDAAVGMTAMLEKVSAATGLSTDDLLNGKMPTRREVAASADLDENDPLVGKLVRELKAARAETAAVAAKAEELRKNALGPMLNTYLEDYYETRWEDKIAPSLPEGANLDLKKAMDYANENGLKDRKGRLDLVRAAKELTYDQRVQAEAKKQADAIVKKREDEAVLASVPRPNSLGQRVKTDKTLQKQVGSRFETKNFDDVLNDALADTDMWRGIQGNA